MAYQSTVGPVLVDSQVRVDLQPTDMDYPPSLTGDPPIHHWYGSDISILLEQPSTNISTNISIKNIQYSVDVTVQRPLKYHHLTTILVIILSDILIDVSTDIPCRCTTDYFGRYKYQLLYIVSIDCDTGCQSVKYWLNIGWVSIE